MRQGLSKFGGQLGIGIIVLGILIIFLGWNGAASWDRVQSQFPYLISGGVLGLAVVIVGAALMMIQAAREDRARLEGRLEELRRSIDALALSGSASNGSRRPAGAAAGQPSESTRVVAGPSSFHRTSCRLLEGRDHLPEVDIEEAKERGLSPCRVCNPVGASRSARSRS